MILGNDVWYPNIEIGMKKLPVKWSVNESGGQKEPSSKFSTFEDPDNNGLSDPLTFNSAVKAFDSPEFTS